MKRRMKRISLLWFALVIILSGTRASAWVDGEVLVWIGGDKGWRGFAELGKKCEAELGIPVKVEPMDGLTDKFQTAAQGGKGPDIVVWAHDRLGEWADAGILQPLEISEEFKAGFLPLTWEAVTHNKQVWGYPIALEAISLIYNKQLVSGTPPTQLSEIKAFAKELQRQHPKVMPIMWEYGSPYFSWPFLASNGGYAFKRSEHGYDLADSGVNAPGAVQGLQEIVDLINSGLMPKGITYSVIGQKMCSGELAMMISGPWSWLDLRKCGIDFDLAVLPGIGGKPGRPFVGVLSALINRASPNTDLAAQFLEKVHLHRARTEDDRCRRGDWRSGTQDSRGFDERRKSFHQDHLPKRVGRSSDAEHSSNGQVLERHGSCPPGGNERTSYSAGGLGRSQ